MKWHWYIGRANELLLDLDSDKALWYAAQRLRRNLRSLFGDLRRSLRTGRKQDGDSEKRCKRARSHSLHVASRL